VHADACVKGELPAFDITASLDRGEVHGKAVVFSRQDVVTRDTRRWLDDPGIRDVPREGDRIVAGQPICTVLVTGSNEAGCYVRLVERAARIYGELPSYPAT